MKCFHSRGLQCVGLVKADSKSLDIDLVLPFHYYFFPVVSHAGRSCLESLIFESFRLSSYSQPSGSILPSVPGRVQPKWKATHPGFWSHRWWNWNLGRISFCMKWRVIGVTRFWLWRGWRHFDEKKETCCSLSRTMMLYWYCYKYPLQ